MREFVENLIGQHFDGHVVDPGHAGQELERSIRTELKALHDHAGRSTDAVRAEARTEPS